MTSVTPIGRMPRQQYFIDNFAKQAGKKINLSTLPSACSEIYETVNTNMSLPEILRLARKLYKMDRDNIRKFCLPGNEITIKHLAFVDPDLEKFDTVWKEATKW